MLKSKSGHKKFIFVGVIVILVAAAVGLYLHGHNNTSSNLAMSHTKQTVKGSTSKPTPHQISSNNSAGPSGGVIDKNGQTSGYLPPSSQWVSSSSGNITLQQPSPNSVVRSGDTLSGLAKVSSVQFILTDNSVGLIARGNLNVVDGKFSGTLMFTSHSKSGKLEVYYPNPKNGAEEDIIDIDVSFSP